MKKDDPINSIVGISGPNPLTILYSSLLNSIAYKESKLTREEKQAREERRRLAAEREMRKAQVLKNVCPNCEGKLVRGKKDKNNDYKRLWDCRSCKNQYTSDGDIT